MLKNDTIRNGTFFSLFSFINKGINFLLLLILANFITPAEYGYLNLFNTIVMVIGYFIAMSSEGYLSVSYFSEGKDSVIQCVSCTLLTTSIVAVLFLLSILLKGSLISNFLNLPQQLLYLAVFTCFFSVFFRMAMNYFRIQKKVYAYGIISCGNAILYFIASILLIKYMQLSWEGCVFSQFGSNLIFGLFALGLFLYKKFISIPSVKYWKKMLFWGLPLIPHLATIFIRQGCDRYIINHFHGINEVGLFSFALNLTNIIIMIGMSFNDSNSVELFEILGNKDINNEKKKNLLQKQKRYIFKIYLFSSLIILTFGFFLTPIVLPKYEASVNYFAILTLYGFFHCLYFLYTNFLFYFKKNKILMYFTFFSAILHLALSLALTKYSLFATCFIYCFSQLIVVFFVRNYAKKLLERELYL